MFEFLKKLFKSDKYESHSEAVIISCYFNPNNNPYRLSAFKRYYETIKHLNHMIIECTFNENDPKQLLDMVLKDNYMHMKANQIIWHKESLINMAVSHLPKQFKYVFWIDADIIFSNKSWLTQAVAKLQGNYRIIQPFEYCYHMEKDQESIPLDEQAQVVAQYDLLLASSKRPKNVWKSFASNWENSKRSANSNNYDVHGHVGFAWGARREVLDNIPLFTKALTGGADHIIAHAAVGHIPCECITKTYTEIIDEIKKWSIRFYSYTKGYLGYVDGAVFHIWHGDLEKRDYYNRIKKFTKHTKETKLDKNGFHEVSEEGLSAFKTYYADRESIVPDPIGVLNYLDYKYPENNSLTDDTIKEPQFGGGEFGGAGASSSWDDKKEIETVSTDNQNFS